MKLACLLSLHLTACGLPAQHSTQRVKCQVKMQVVKIPHGTENTYVHIHIGCINTIHPHICIDPIQEAIQQHLMLPFTV